MNKLLVLRQAVADKETALRAAKAAARVSVEESGKPMTDEHRAAIKTAESDLESARQALADFEALREEERQPDAPLAPVAPAAKATPTRVEVPDMSTRPGFFGRQLQAVRSAALALKGGSALAASEMDILRPMMAGPTGLNSDVPSEGGFLVQPERSSTILQRAYQTGEILSRVRTMPIGAGSNGMTMPAIDETSRADNSRYGGIVSGWLGQGNTLSAGKPKFRILDMKLRKVGAFVYATDEQLSDAVALEGWINQYLPLELRFRTEDAIVNGTGANQPLGWMNSGALIAATRTGAGHVVFDDVKNMWLRMWAPLRQSAVWFIDQSVEGDLEQLSIAIGTGGALAPVYKPAGSVPGQTFATLYGRPVIPVEYCAALGTSGDIQLVAPQEYITIDKGGINQAVSLHVAFLTDESVFRFMYRVDGQLAWNAALTPKSGGDTLSPVVVLT